MDGVEFLRDRKSPERLMDDLSRKIAACESMLEHCAVSLTDISVISESPEALVDEWKIKLFDFMAKTLYPSIWKLRKMQQGKIDTKEVPNLVEELSQWLMTTEKHFGPDDVKKDLPRATVRSFSAEHDDTP